MLIIVVSILTLVADLVLKAYANSFAGFEFLVCKTVSPTLNEGGVFSLPMPNAILIFVTAILLALILYWIKHEKLYIQKITSISLGLIIGGGVGNLYDRITQGGVVDFISCSFWPVFNFADMAVVIGVVMLIFGYRRKTNS